MIRLTKRQILLLHEQLIRETGGSGGLRDETLLESALEAPFQTYDGQELYPTVQAKAARLGYGLIMNALLTFMHPGKLLCAAGSDPLFCGFRIAGTDAAEYGFRLIGAAPGIR